MIKDILLSRLYMVAVLARCCMQHQIGFTEPGVRALVVRGNEIVLVRHRGGLFPWGLPGGGVKPHESLEKAVRREVWEEAGCKVRIERLLGVFDTSHGNSATSVGVFVCVPLTDLRPPKADVEIATARYTAIDALPNRTDELTRYWIHEYLATFNKPIYYDCYRQNREKLAANKGHPELV